MQEKKVAVQQRLRLARALSIDTTEAYFTNSSEGLLTFISFRNEASAAATVLKQLIAGRMAAGRARSLVSRSALRQELCFRAGKPSKWPFQAGLLARPLQSSDQASSGP